MPEIKLTGKPQAQRVADRLRGSSEGNNANETFRHGEGPTRTITSIYHGSTQGGLKRGNDSERSE